MTKVLITIKNTETATVDIGDLPVGLVRDLLHKHDGTFDGNWSPGDVGAQWKVDEITVEEVPGKSAKAK